MAVPLSPAELANKIQGHLVSLDEYLFLDTTAYYPFIVKTTNFYNAVSQQHTNNNVLVDLIVMFHVKHII